MADVPISQVSDDDSVRVEEWPEGRPPIMLKNGHAVAEWLAQFVRSGEADDEPRLFLLSSASRESLDRLEDLYKTCLEAEKTYPAQVPHTPASRGSHESNRAYALAGPRRMMQISPAMDSSPPSRIMWAFTCQGAQWPGMGVELVESNAVFGQAIRRMDDFLASLPSPPASTIEADLRDPAFLIRHIQTVFFRLTVAVQIALVQVLRSWNLAPDLVFGCSTGEIAAAYASGALSAEAAIAIAYFIALTAPGDEDEKRALLFAVLGLGQQRLIPYLKPGVFLTGDASPSHSMLCGDADQVQSVFDNIREQQPLVPLHLFRTNSAWHTGESSSPLLKDGRVLTDAPGHEDLVKHMLALQEAIQSLGQAAEPTEPAIPFFSTVTGRRLEGSASLGASYWRANLEGIIEFGRCFQAAIGDRRDRVLVIEIGPHPFFKRYVGYWTEELGLDLVYLHTLERDVSCRQSLLRLSGQLFQHKIQAQGVEQSIYQSI
ncbi:polyketide synthase [Ophiocordyceps camponoti-floridani]|uniref:Polyketide synthase n=1 Tax=Ophiocordyceps camponoti-floridani TaxID=2030778 RepID=A0A8H4Q1Q3_9HYPO|nr:polyketide synthase [Ophiocordyceps camponoti-floridani]